MFWTPFDQRFSQTLDRFKAHVRLFEVNLDYVYNEDTLKTFSNIDKAIQENSARRRERENEKERMKTDSLSKQPLRSKATHANLKIESMASELRRWIDAPDWTRAHNEANKRRVDGSCQWFIDQETYSAWAVGTALQGSESAPFANLLFVSGKSPHAVKHRLS